jgi:hypothetical protein
MQYQLPLDHFAFAAFIAFLAKTAKDVKIKFMLTIYWTVGTLLTTNLREEKYLPREEEKSREGGDLKERAKNASIQ